MIQIAKLSSADCLDILFGSGWLLPRCRSQVKTYMIVIRGEDALQSSLFVPLYVQVLGIY